MSDIKEKKKEQAKVVRVAQMVTGVLMMAISFPCIASSAHDIIMGADKLSGAISAGSFFLMVAMLGAMLGFFGLKSYRKLNDPAAKVISSVEERDLLKTIAAMGGEVSVAQLAMHSPLSIAEATAFLNRLEVDGVAYSSVNADAAIVYTLPSLAPSSTEDDRFVFEHAQAEVKVDQES